MDASLLNVGLVLTVLLLGGIAGLSRTKLADLRADNDDIRKARDDARSDRTEIAAEKALCAAELERRKDEIETLRKIVTGEAHLSHIEALLMEHDKKAEAAWTLIMRRLQETRRNPHVED